MRFYLSLFALLCLVSLTAHAQNAGLRVSVTDPHGAFVPGAVAQLQNAQGKAVKSATTNQRGEATLNAAARDSFTTGSRRQLMKPPCASTVRSRAT
jgi:hypothetical protein